MDIVVNNIKIHYEMLGDGKPIILLLFCLLIYWIGFLIFDVFPTPNELGPALGQAVMFSFIIIVICMFIVIPYIQALIILVLRKIIESDENKNGK